MLIHMHITDVTLEHMIPQRNETHVPKSFTGGKFKAISQNLPREATQKIN